MKIGIIGAGAWGTALASVMAKHGNVTIWANEPEVADAINIQHCNNIFLPDIQLPTNIRATTQLAGLIESDIILLVSPAQFVRSICEQLSFSGLGPNIPIVICSKGIEKDSLKLMSQVVSEYFCNKIAILAGPNFAIEVAQNHMSMSNIASSDLKLANELANKLSTPKFKLIPIDDIITAQITASIKNIMAIAFGMAESIGFSQNTKAAMYCEAIKEIAAITRALGGKEATLTELCGIGDLILTCSSSKSRNMSLGKMLANGKSLEQIRAEKNTVAEGVFSSAAVKQICIKHKIKAPICDAIYKILYESADKTELENVLAFY